MPTDPAILATLGLDRLIDGNPFRRTADRKVSDETGARFIFVGAEAIRGFHHVIERERNGAWRATMKVCGQACGKRIGVMLDARLAAVGKPALAALPLEACLLLLERTFAVQGWGRVSVDLSHAGEHGLVIARVEHSFFVEALPKVDDFVDASLAGMLQGFFEHITGQILGSEEIACVRRGAPHCTIVIAPPDRLASVAAMSGRETADAIIARLVSGT